MGVREFDAWLEKPADTGDGPDGPKGPEELARERDASAARLRFRSLWQDMRQHIEEKDYGHQANRWRLAAYAVWYSTPKDLRPVQFQNELARLLGMADDENFRKWRKQYGDLFDDEAVKRSIKELIVEHIPGVIIASINCATKDGYQGHQDRKMLAEIAGVYKPRQVQQLEGGDKPVRVTDDALTDDERAARIAALLDRARARRAGQPAEE